MAAEPTLLQSGHEAGSGKIWAVASPAADQGQQTVGNENATTACG